MICAAEEDLERNSNMQQKKETFKEQMDRQHFHTHCSYVRARRSPYLRQQISDGGEHILHIPWCLCQGTTFSWHTVPTAKPCGSLVGLKRCQVGASSMPTRWVILPAGVGMYMAGPGEGQTPRLTKLLLWAELASWSCGLMLCSSRDVGHWWGTWGGYLYQPLSSK